VYSVIPDMANAATPTASAPEEPPTAPSAESPDPAATPDWSGSN